MATSPTTKSALLSGAAKDDALGADGSFTFTIADLLGNDPGGAAKINTDTQFFFGDIGTTDNQTPQAQAQYLIDHGITDNGDGTYTIGTNGIDFNYFVQIGNKGTWSTAHVDVTAPEPDHKGALLWEETFDDYTVVDDHGQWGTVNLSAKSDGHAWAVIDPSVPGGWGQVAGEIVEGEAFEGSIASTSGDYWLDTQNSPGGINIHNWFTDPTGGKFVLSFDLGIHDFGTGPKEETAHDATFEVKVDGVTIDSFTWADFEAKPDMMEHFEYELDLPGDAAGNHGISLVDTTASEGNFVGFAIDTIQVHDWIG